MQDSVQQSPIPSPIASTSGSPIEDLGAYFDHLSLAHRPLFIQNAWTLLPIVEACDNCEPPRGPFGPEHLCTTDDGAVPFYFDADDRRQPIGFLLPAVVEALLRDNAHMESMRMSSCWQAMRRNDGSIWAVAIAEWLRFEGRAGLVEHFDRVARTWKQEGKFGSELDGWRNEAYTIYGPPRLATPEGDLPSPLPGANAIFRIERAATPMFGFLTFGVHMTGYCLEPKTGAMSLWVPRRSLSKPTYPGMLDNTVAGGITAGLTPFETLVKECAEEASLPAAFVEKHARAAGAISYIRKGSGGFIQPEVQYVYDLLFPPEAPPPKPNDDEVQSFSLMTDREVLDCIQRGEFKYNCAVVLIDFFVRHGRITPESDTRFMDLCSRMRRRMPLPGPV